ncbi:MBOAT-domain-containing protein [Auriculariales sp. MPI-PUGE-AT-0066]|nr:MBOAT-domain-containing protein [Auriculariales sp. MPI-PUGE-AT-0066]
MATVDVEMAATSQTTTTTRPTARKPRGILQLTVDVPYSTKSNNATPRPVRWRTPEFMAYFVVLIIALPLGILTVMRLSDSSHPNYPQYARRLSTSSIIPWRKVDNSDHQYRTFRNNIPALTGLAALFFITKGVYARFQPSTPETRIRFIFVFAVAMQLGLHGAGALKVATILCANFAIGRALKDSRVLPFANWAFNLVVLFANERYDGYRFASLHPMLGALDSLSGAYPRWHITFNITMLRLISFNMDWHWASRRVESLDTGGELSEKQRLATSHELSVYESFENYVTYILYPPLYIAGPIMSFNDFLWQIRRPVPLSAKETIGYAMRFLVCLGTMELILHYMYVVAIKDSRAWAGDTPAQLCMLGFWNLIVVWLKLLIPWRFFRLWALADGMQPPENMVRCMANNYSALAFWRTWHRSYNLWTVRYIYVPVGGARRQLPAMVLVFTFVALWHDLQLRLLMWGWLISLFVLPEILAHWAVPEAKFGKEGWYRHLCAAGAVGNILMMMAANLVGFVLGVDGTKYLLSQLFGTFAGWQFLFVASAVIFVVVQLMFEYREEEMRQGIYRRY